MNPLTIQYLFTYPDGHCETNGVTLDPKTLDNIDPLPASLPAWTALNFHQCPHCPLSLKTHAHCPVAARVATLLKCCGTLLSFNELHIDVITHERTVSKDTTAQKAVCSLMGLVMATSGCPHVAWFKPMARFHLPLSSEEETIYRATSMYLLAQFFKHTQGHEPDISLSGLKTIYRNIHLMNMTLAERFRIASNEDVTVNALTLLDLFAWTLPLTIEDSLDEIRYLFDYYLNNPLPRDP